MSEVEISFGDNASDTAILLLAAAAELGRDASEVRTTKGAFVVPEEIADAAGYGAAPEEDDKIVDKDEAEIDEEVLVEPEPAKKPAAKKPAAKKTAAKKAAAKKTPAKKAAAKGASS